MVVTRTMAGRLSPCADPETKAATLECPAEGEWLGIRFKLGTFMPTCPQEISLIEEM